MKYWGIFMIKRDFRRKLTMCLASVMALNLGISVSVKADEGLKMR